MNIWPFKRKQRGGGLQVGVWNMQRPDREQSDYVTEGFDQCTVVYACVTEVANVVAEILSEWQLYRGDGDDAVEVTDHPLLDLLTHPNDDQDGFEFFSENVAQHLLFGNSYIEAIPAGGGVTELWNQPPQKMRVFAGAKRGEVERIGLEYKPNQFHWFDVDLILHRKMFNPHGGVYGAAPLKTAMLATQTHNSILKWNRDLVENQATPSLALIAKDGATIPEDRWEQIKEELRNKVFGGGDSKPGGAILVDGGEFDLHKLGMTPADLDWIRGSDLTTREICRVYNVPPEIIGVSSAKTYSNYAEARQALYLETGIPLTTRIVSGLNRWLVPMFGDDLWLDFDRNGIEAIQEDRTALYTRTVSAFQASLLTRNEARAAIGLGPVSGGDVLAVPFSAMEVAATPEKGRKAHDKALGIPDDEKKTAYWKRFDARREPWIPRVTAMVAAEFDTERKALMDRYRTAATVEQLRTATESVIDGRRDDWQELFERVYQNVGGDFAEDVYDEIVEPGKGSAGRRTDKQRGNKQHGDWNRWIVQYLARSAATKVQQVSDTTKDAIRAELAAGVAEREGIDQLRKRIDTLSLEKIIPNRSEVIARTEVVSASNLGSISGARSTGLDLYKSWLTTPDPRTRETHAEAGGQRVPLDGTFRVGDYELDHPGDTSHGAGPEEVIQCRCTVVYEPRMEEEST